MQNDINNPYVLKYGGIFLYEYIYSFALNEFCSSLYLLVNYVYAIDSVESKKKSRSDLLFITVNNIFANIVNRE